MLSSTLFAQVPLKNSFIRKSASVYICFFFINYIPNYHLFAHWSWVPLGVASAWIYICDRWWISGWRLSSLLSLHNFNSPALLSLKSNNDSIRANAKHVATLERIIILAETVEEKKTDSNIRMEHRRLPTDVIMRVAIWKFGLLLF